jgi:enoyl-CoA hydratase/carnithine racemase
MADPSWEEQFEMIREGQRALTAIEFSSKPVVMAIYDVICMGGFTIRRRSSMR